MRMRSVNGNGKLHLYAGAEARAVTRRETCVHCRRWLVTVYEDGQFDLASKALVAVGIVVPVDADGEPVPGRWPAQPVEGSATCERWRCRLRRRLAEKRREP